MIWQQNIDKVNRVIREALQLYDHPYLSMSWGKDSIFLLYLVRKIKPDIPVIFLNSGYSLPDTYSIRDRLIKEWNLNYYEIKQPVDYIELCKQVGLPHERSNSEQSKAVQVLKKNVLDEFAIDHSFDLCFWGIRCDESNGRSFMFRKNGYFIKSTEINKCHPIALITLQQLWYFYDKFQIPYNKIYLNTKFLKREQIRNTGWISTDGANDGKIVWLKYYYPDFYNKLQKEFSNVRTHV